MALDLSSNPYSRTGDQFAVHTSKHLAADEITDQQLRVAILNRKFSKVVLSSTDSADVTVGPLTLEDDNTDEVDAPIHYCIGGVMYLAEGDTVEFTDTSVQRAGTTKAYLISVDAEGDYLITNGLELPVFQNNITDEVTVQGPTGPFVPPLREDHAPVGVVVITTGASTDFTPGTTKLDAEGITAVFHDLSAAVRRVPS